MLISTSLMFWGFLLFVKLFGSLKTTVEKLYSGNRKSNSKPFDQCDFSVACSEKNSVCMVLGKKIINIYQAQLFLIHFYYLKKNHVDYNHLYCLNRNCRRIFHILNLYIAAGRCLETSAFGL